VESHEILREAFEKKSPKEIASALGISLSLVYKWSQPPSDGQGSGSLNPLDRTTELMTLTKDPGIIKWLCYRAGGFFVRNRVNKEVDYKKIVPTMNSIIQQFADLLGAITDSSSDRKITKAETDRIRRHWDDLKTFTEGFVRACEEGNFDQIEAQKQKLKSP
jgi:hypothetical protein